MFQVGAVRIGVVLGLIVVGAVAGAAFNFAPLFLAIPVGLVALVVVLIARSRGGREEEDGDVDRSRLGAERVEFTERDRRTLL